MPSDHREKRKPRYGRKMILELWFLVTSVWFCDGNCTFPSDLSGTWHASDIGEVNFNSTHMDTRQSVSSFGLRTFECLHNVDDRYLLVSDVIYFLGSPFQIGLCWEIQKISDVKYLYYAATDMLPNTTNSRILFKLYPHTFDINSDCLFSSSYEPWLTRVLIKQGFNGKIPCPATLQANFTYTYDSGSGNQCTGDSFLDVCSDASRMTFDYSQCSAKQGYSENGVLDCVYHISHGDVIYMIAYNNDTNSPDESSFYRYTCYVLQVDQNTSVTHMTQFPQACMSDQTARVVDPPGAYLELNISSQVIPVSSEKVLTTSLPPVATGSVIVIGAVSGAFGVMVALFIVFSIYKKCKPKSIEPAESLFASRQSFDQVKSNYSANGRISPYSPRPTLSEIAFKRFGPLQTELDFDDESEMSICDSFNSERVEDHDNIDYDSGNEYMENDLTSTEFPKQTQEQSQVFLTCEPTGDIPQRNSENTNTNNEEKEENDDVLAISGNKQETEHPAAPQDNDLNSDIHEHKLDL